MIAGRDAQQNELVVKRYMKPGDVYVHADLHGAASVIVKNNDASQEIPPRTLEEAATMAVCHSSAWEAKIVTRSWWVRPDQVSKTAPSGEYLSVGAFMIRGKKNYLPLTQLILGFGFLFKLDDESAARHVGERSGKNIAAQDPAEEVEVEVPVADDSDDEENGVPEFPDTKVRTLSINSDGIEIEDEITLVSSAEPRVKKQYIKLTKKIGKNAASKSQRNHPTVGFVEQQQDTQNLKPVPHEMSRSQRAKLKKIKKKYKDQDEDDKAIRMAILGKTPDGKPLEMEKNKKNKRSQKFNALTETIKSLQTKTVADDECNDEEAIANESNVDNETSDVAHEAIEQNKAMELATADDVSPDELDSDDSDTESRSSNDKIPPHVRLLNSLTSQPTSEDNLLFCIPVVGPYSSMTNYKFKVKVIPGSSRRGKAAKTALHLFMNDKNVSRREKDLLKNAKDMDISKNLPAKIKITTGFSVKKH